MLYSLLVDLIDEHELRGEAAQLLEFVAYSTQFRDIVVVITPESDARVLLPD